MARHHIEVHVTALVELATPGVWCDRCALPSAFDVPWVLVDPTIVEVVARGTLRVCVDCGVSTDVVEGVVEDAQRQVDDDPIE